MVSLFNIPKFYHRQFTITTHLDSTGAQIFHADGVISLIKSMMETIILNIFLKVTPFYK